MAGGLAIVLSGGGAKGAFQVGVVHELVVNRGVRLDIVAGVSTGAIQALGVAQDDVPALLDAWLGIRGNSRSEEHTSELQSLMRISYDVFCLQKKTALQLKLHSTIAHKSYPTITQIHTHT